MRIQYKLKFRDVVVFQAVHQFLSPAVQLLYLLLAIWVFNAEFTSDESMVVAIVVAFITYLCVWVFQFAFNAIYLLSKKNGNVLTRHSIELKAEGVSEETRYTLTFVQWPGIGKVVSRQGFVAVYISSQQAHVIPNRAFESTAQRLAFITAIRQKAFSSDTGIS